MSDTQEKKDVVFVKLSKVQQKKLSIEERIDYLKKESEQVLLNAKKHQSKLKEEQDKLLKVVKSQERKDDTRRKILLGSYLLKKMENEENKEKILAEINEYLTQERDRKLFNL